MRIVTSPQAASLQVEADLFDAGATFGALWSAWRRFLFVLMVRIERDVVLAGALLRLIAIVHVAGVSFAGCVVEQSSCAVNRPQLDV